MSQLYSNIFSYFNVSMFTTLIQSICYLQVKDNVSVYNLKLACIASATYFTVMTSWVG